MLRNAYKNVLALSTYIWMRSLVKKPIKDDMEIVSGGTTKETNEEKNRVETKNNEKTEKCSVNNTFRINF